MRKAIICITFILISMSCLVACQSETQNLADDSRINIVTTSFPVYDFTRAVARDTVSLSMLLSPGAELHTYEPSPQDIIAISQCDLFIYIGGESETWADRVLNSIDTSNMTIVRLMDSVEIESLEHEHEHDDEKHLYDDHIWTSPQNAILMVETISIAMCQADTQNTQVYTDNTTQYIEELISLNNDFQQIVDNSKRNLVIFGDRFPFYHLAELYDIEHLSALNSCSTDTDCSAATISMLIDEIKANNIPVVFYIEQSNQRITDTLCEATGAKKLLFHSVQTISREDFDSGIGYIQLMERNATHLREALN